MADATAPTDSAPYEDILELGRALATELECAARGGEGFSTCTLWDTSKKAVAFKRAADQRTANLVVLERRRTEREDRERQASKRGGDGAAIKESRKERAERKRKERLDAAKGASPVDKVGDILATSYITCPKVKGQKQPCGAAMRDGVVCRKFVDHGKCSFDHTPLNQMSAENQLIWFDYVVSTAGLSFNPKTVTCFERNGDDWVRP